MTRRLHEMRRGLTVTLVDSITEIAAEDAGRIVVSGSHGGASAASYAVKVVAALYVFNDAGVGKDRAGIVGLDMLQAAGIAACAVGHDSARIGEAEDTLESGVISALNESAARMGLTSGMSLLRFLAAGSG